MNEVINIPFTHDDLLRDCLTKKENALALDYIFKSFDTI